MELSVAGPELLFGGFICDEGGVFIKGLGHVKMLGWVGGCACTSAMARFRIDVDKLFRGESWFEHDL